MVTVLTKANVGKESLARRNMSARKALRENVKSRNFVSATLKGYRNFVLRMSMSMSAACP